MTVCLTSAPMGQIRGFRNGGFLVHRSHQGAKMNKKSGTSKDAADKLVKGIKRKTRKHYSAEEKIRIVLAGLRGDTARQATSPEVKDLRSESSALKEVVADLTLENRLLKKSMIGDGECEA